MSAAMGRLIRSSVRWPRDLASNLQLNGFLDPIRKIFRFLATATAHREQEVERHEARPIVGWRLATNGRSFTCYRRSW